jgi:hypothetical protein
MRSILLPVALVLAVGCSRRAQPEALVPPALPAREIFNRAVTKICPSAEDGPALKQVLVNLAADLGIQHLIRVTDGRQPPLHAFVHVDLRPARLARDGFPVRWVEVDDTHRVCMRLDQVDQVDPQSPPLPKTVDCEPPALETDGGLLQVNIDVRAQIHLDCNANSRALVFARPHAFLPADGGVESTHFFGDFDVWLEVDWANGRLRVGGGCFPAWDDTLRTFAALDSGASVQKFCTPLYLPDGSGSRVPWHFLKAEPAPTDGGMP